MNKDQKPVGSLFINETSKGTVFKGEVEINGVKTNLVGFVKDSFKDKDGKIKPLILQKGKNAGKPYSVLRLFVDDVDTKSKFTPQ